MKKLIFSILCIFALACSASAQGYSNSFGIVAGMSNGLSYKHVTNHFFAQADLSIGLNYAPIGHGMAVNRAWDFRLNPNAGYQLVLADGNTGKFSGFAGGGFSIGETNLYPKYSPSGYTECAGGVFGVNAIAGVEYAFDALPFCIGFDFRPGYGLFFDSETAIHAFDWRLNLAIRWTF